MMLQSELNEVSEVFKTDYGYHFLEVLGTRNFDRTVDDKEIFFGKDSLIDLEEYIAN